MSRFKHIDCEDLCPNDDQHVDYAEVYRAVKSTDVLKVDDFLPSSVEYKNQGKTFRSKLVQAFYGMSVFTDLDSLNKKINDIPSLKESTRAIAKGFTTLNRGISTVENKDHHVNYYLFDYENNSPKDDFQIFEVKGK